MASDKKPPRSARRNAVPINVVTWLADFAGENPIYFLKYITKLLAFAKNAKFSNTSTPAIIVN